MDPLSALSIATSVIQFLDFGANLLCKGTEIYHSAQGSLVENVQLEAIASNMLELNRELQNSTYKVASLDNRNLFGQTLDEEDLAARRRNLTKDRSVLAEEKRIEKSNERFQQELHAISASCTGAAADLLEAVQRLKISGRTTRWRSFRHALLAVWNAERVEELTSRLDRWRSQLNTNLLFWTRYV